LDKINLLVINQYASTPRYSSGSGERFYYLAPFFQKEGINTRVISGGYNHLFVTNPQTPRLFNNERVEGALFTWVKLRYYDKDSLIGRLLSWIEFFVKLFFLRHKEKPDVVLVSSMSLFPIFYAFYLRLLFGAKVILEVRDIWPLTPMELGGYGHKNLFILLMFLVEKWAYRGSDVLTSVLPDFDKHVRGVLGQEKPIHWIPNAIQSSLVPEERSSISRNAKDKFIVIYTGAIGIANAMERIIDLAILLQDEKHILFRIVGEGPKKSYLMEKVEANGLSNVEFMDKVQKNKVVDLLAEADIAIIAWNDSRLYDFGVSANKYNDYMLTGLPIISSSNILSDPVNLADCGFQVPTTNLRLFAAKVLDLSNKSSTELSDIGKKGRRFVLENQTYDIIGPNYMKIIKNLFRQ
jgi:glycosyltransferase involved in cell wall biosynthesis